MADIIQKIQFKRGTKAILESRLTKTDLGVLAQGEPAYETDTGKLKIGNGISNYADLPYVGGSSGGLDPRFEITDPTNGQILVYDELTEKWVNKTSLFEISTEELINGKVYDVLWRVKPTTLNTVSGVATDRDTGEVFDIKSTRGIITADKFTSESDTILSEDINNLFK